MRLIDADKIELPFACDEDEAYLLEKVEEAINNTPTEINFIPVSEKIPTADKNI